MKYITPNFSKLILISFKRKRRIFFAINREYQTINTSDVKAKILIYFLFPSRVFNIIAHILEERLNNKIPHILKCHLSRSLGAVRNALCNILCRHESSYITTSKLNNYASTCICSKSKK